VLEITVWRSNFTGAILNTSTMNGSKEIRKNETLLNVLAALLILLFVYTTFTKIMDWQRFRASLLSSPLLHLYASSIVWVVPVSELTVAACLFFPRLRFWGFLSASFLLLLFTGYIGYMLMANEHLPCTCGGIIEKLSWQQHFVLNCVLTLLAATGTYLEHRHDVFIAINRSCPKPVEKSRRIFYLNRKQ
jgi:hypothetical protein